MAGKKAGAPSRSAFIRDQLAKNKKSKFDDINEAWKKSGHSGGITRTLFYQVKSKKRGRRGGRRGRGASEAAAAERPSSEIYLAIEISLERLGEQAHGLGNKQLAEALRAARRIASAKLV